MVTLPEVGSGTVGPPPHVSGRVAAICQTLSSRVVPTITFGLVDLLFGQMFISDVGAAMTQTPTPHQMLVLIGEGLYFLFDSLVIVLLLIRPPARSKDARLSSWLLAMFGTFGLTIAPMLPSGPVIFHSGIGGALVESLALVIALTMALVALNTLGGSFSITPQARHLVARGPYRVVRHPLYLFEAMAIISATFSSGATTMIICAVLVLASQVRRAQLEERLLSKTFPEYEDAFRGVPRFLPGIY